MASSAGFGSASHAIILGLDGLQVGTLHSALASDNAPTLKALRERGAFTDDARCTQPSTSLPNWASTLFSAPPTFHGVHTTRLDDAVRPATYGPGALWPNLFTAARVQRPALSTAAFYSWPPLAQLLPRASLNASILQSCASCDECLRVEPHLLSAYTTGLRRSKYGLSWLYLDVLDECGHARGGYSPTYPALIQRVDAWVKQVLDALRAAGIADKTAILIMSDHGRDRPTARDHGGFTTEELAVQWLLVGPGVKAGYQLRGPVSIMDGAPTLLHALGIRPPAQFYGRVVGEAFEGGEGGWHAPNASAVPFGKRPACDTVTQRRAGCAMAAAPAQSGAGDALGEWDGASLLAGSLLGAGVVACLGAVAVALGGLSRAARNPKPLLFSSHPAANRLRAAAGEPDYEMQGLLR